MVRRRPLHRRPGAGQPQPRPTRQAQAAPARASRLGYAAPRYDEKIPSDTVVAQDPGSAARILKGGTITLTLSLGPERTRCRTWPARTYDLAQADLTGAKLVVAKGTARYDDTLPAGRTWSTPTRRSGTEVQPGAKVTVIAEQGPGPDHACPNVVGKNLNDARSALRPARAVTGRDVQGLATSRKDEVLEQSPADGTGVEKGAKVKLDVTKGPPQVAVPRVVDLPCQQAKQLLEGQGSR